ncbi:dihydropteroate synthase [Silvanigrella paludirubra]|uniref:dihydropteroate synthase n=2 Tax=Silvanigrella paludirubra TaxID=2499159 RepID=A0A6N6VX24_9BACT|nr:dihydropteroate synthase [Silvanigrella paludirubra]
MVKPKMNISGAKKFENLCNENKTIWMGILNITPDSFSDGGKFNSKYLALKRALELINSGALILDIGGVSTKPYSEKLNSHSEFERVYEIIKFLKNKIPQNILISIDSSSPYVTDLLAKENLIDIINDQFSARIEENIKIKNEFMFVNNAHIASEYQLGYIIMHMQGTPENMQLKPSYENCGNDVILFLKDRLQFAENLGVKYIVLDPGIGFGKTVENNLELISAEFINKLSSLKRPILIGLSRKWFLGQLYPELIEPHTRDKVTKQYEFNCISYGAKIIRSHVMPSEIELNTR